MLNTPSADEAPVKEMLPATDRAMVRYLNSGIIGTYRAISVTADALHKGEIGQNEALQAFAHIGLAIAEAADKVEAYLAGHGARLSAEYFAEPTPFVLPEGAVVSQGNGSIN